MMKLTIQIPCDSATVSCYRDVTEFSKTAAVKYPLMFNRSTACSIEGLADKHPIASDWSCALTQANQTYREAFFCPSPVLHEHKTVKLTEKHPSASNWSCMSLICISLALSSLKKKHSKFIMEGPCKQMTIYVINHILYYAQQFSVDLNDNYCIL